ncbi:hypothetical protein QUB76_31010 [Microcoleus sp. D2B6]|uniref:hypothetical protein n=1 Tax=Microcoleus sp. C2C6 TaxID=3055325 RepID=UPI002FD5C6B9
MSARKTRLQEAEILSTEDFCNQRRSPIESDNYEMKKEVDRDRVIRRHLLT